MQEFTIHTIGGGDLIISSLNAIASIIHSSSYMQILQMCALIGLAWGIILASFGDKPFTDILKNMLTVAIVLHVLILPKTKVVVIDKIDNGVINSLPSGAVENVPMGVALFSWVSVLGAALTELTESGLQSVDSGGIFPYSQYGMIFGSKLINTTGQAKIQDADFERDVQTYLKSCVIKDINLERLSLQTIKESGDLWGLITGNDDYLPNMTLYAHLRKGYNVSRDNSNTPTRTQVTDQYIRCDKAGQQINSHWQSIEKRSVTEKLAGVIFPKLSDTQSNQMAAYSRFINALGASMPANNILRNLSKDASSLIEQNMAINVLNAAIKAGSSQGLSAHNVYLHTRAEMQSRKVL